jgi:hypothetical protein
MLFSNKNKKQKKENALDNVLKNPKILEVNLIRDEVKLGFDWKTNGKSLAAALLVAIFIIAELYLGLDWWQKDEEVRLEQTKTVISKTAKDIADFRKSAADALSYQDKAIEVNSLLDHHIYWTQFFNWLERDTLSTVTYGNFSGQTDGKYNLSGSASSFADVSWQVKTFHDDPITLNVSVETVSDSGAGQETKEEAKKLETATPEEIAAATAARNLAAQNKVGFNMLLEIKPEIFNK